MIFSSPRRLLRRSCPLCLVAFLTLSALSIVHAQPATDPPGSGSVLLEVGREKFTAANIADVFRRNANRGGKSFYELDRDSALAFLNLFAGYRLKVQAALDAGINRRPEVIEELRANRIQLAVPPPPASGYLIERKVVDPAVERIFKRRDDELLLGIIYKSMNGDDPADTLRAFNSVMSMLGMIHNGGSFEGLARDSSDDPGTKDAGGRLPNYITGGMILPVMEDAGYELKPGQVLASPLRMPGGYIIIKLLDRSPRLKVHAAHILITAEATAPENGPEHAKAEATLARIRAGESFEKVAREASDDQTSGANGGDFLGFYTRSLGFEAKNARLDRNFEEALYKLKDGEISDVVRTQYGFHIIKRIESRRPTFEEEKETIRQFYKQRLMADDRAAYVVQVVDKNGLRLNTVMLDQLIAATSRRGTTADSAWASGVSPGLRREKLFSFGFTDFSVGAWIDSVKTRPDLRSTPLTSSGMREAIYRFLEQPAMIAESKNLESEYPDFNALMNELRDGTLIFHLEDSVVYKKLNQGYEEAKGQAFFEAHRDRYNTPVKLALTEIFLYNESDVKDVLDQIRAGKVPFDTLAAARTQRRGYRERGGRWTLSNGRNTDLVKQVLERELKPKPGAILQPFSYQGGFSIIRIDTVESSRPMSYDEARSEVQSDYLDNLQKQLTRDWLNTLEKKYKVKVNDKTLKSVLAAR